MNALPLPVVSSYRDLGIIITNDLSVSTYVTNIVLKAHQRANLIHPCFTSCSVKLLLRSFVTYICQLLEHTQQRYFVSTLQT